LINVNAKLLQIRKKVNSNRCGYYVGIDTDIADRRVPVDGLNGILRVSSHITILDNEVPAGFKYFISFLIVIKQIYARCAV